MLQHLKYDINTASFDRGTQRHSLFWWVDIICHGWCGNKSPAQNEGPQRNKVLIKIALSLMQEVVWDVGHQQDTP